jgi:hypothetical protein
MACLVVSLLLSRVPARADATNQSPPALTIDLAHPAVMTGTFYEIGSNRKTILFKYRRQATRDGDAIRVEQSFTLPDGSLACRESILYRHGQLVSYTMHDLRAKSNGSILVEPDPKKPKMQRLQLEFLDGSDGARIRKTSETLQPNTLISDTIYPFILAHWDELLQGASVKFRFVSLDPSGTFGFRLIKTSDSTWQGRPVVGIKMEPGNFIIAHWIRPIFFTIEKAAPHRVFSYTGRTTPRNNVGGDWKFVDAEAVFDWP